MDTGIVTTGRLDFERWGMSNVIFDGSNREIRERAPEIANNLAYNNHLPDLLGINITFIGLGDVALPQSPLAPNVRIGLEYLWRKIFETAGARPRDIRFESIRSEGNANTPERGFMQPVKTIDFFDDEHGFPVRILFRFGTPEYANPVDAERVLVDVAGTVNRYLQNRPDTAYIYLFGSESKDADRAYNNILSTRRAERVMNDLARLGVSRNKMRALGVAVYMPSPPRREDRPNNVFDPIEGAFNQKVLVTPSDIPNQAFLNRVKAESDRLILQQRGGR
jgi:hypothetical protein